MYWRRSSASTSLHRWTSGASPALRNPFSAVLRQTNNRPSKNHSSFVTAFALPNICLQSSVLLVCPRRALFVARDRVKVGRRIALRTHGHIVRCNRLFWAMLFLCRSLGSWSSCTYIRNGNCGHVCSYEDFVDVVRLGSKSMYNNIANHKALRGQ